MLRDRRRIGSERGVLTMGIRRIAEAARDESGFSLPELLSAIGLGLLAAAAGMAMVTMAVHTQPKISDRAAQIQQARTLMEEISRELRQGQRISAAAPSQLELLTYTPSDPCGTPATARRLCRVTYACSGSTCTRTERNADGTGQAPARTVASGISSAEVFSYAPAGYPDPWYVGMQFIFPAQGGDDAITLEDGVFLRNWFQSQ